MLLTWSQVSKIMTSSGQRSSCISSPGISSIWTEHRQDHVTNRSCDVRQTQKVPVLLEQANSRGG